MEGCMHTQVHMCAHAHTRKSQLYENSPKEQKELIKKLVFCMSLHFSYISFKTLF